MPAAPSPPVTTRNPSAVLGEKLIACSVGHDDGQDAAAVLAGRLRDELLDPVAESDAGGVAQDQLVDAGAVR